VDSRANMWLKGLSQWKIPMMPSLMEPSSSKHSASSKWATTYPFNVLDRRKYHNKIWTWKCNAPTCTLCRFYVQYPAVRHRAIKEQILSVQIWFLVCSVNYKSGNIFWPLLVTFNPSTIIKSKNIIAIIVLYNWDANFTRCLSFSL
jgi:hypothetical protein